ncbi:adenine deaminase [Anoxybacillus suryakundensis]|uniref:Adenine deaminase n=1 Tax=Anoxybacillus suryakundensis TaxID=1325335 RepID=A0A0K6GPU7_9BACL|nr:adenine deaminase [Anoxybacillus suryakundensis]CUA80749.1 Adenine deaminase [Anoxybacillus suryakundensis]
MKQLAVASKQQLADVVVKNGKIINVFTHEIVQADVAIADGKIVGIGEYDGQTVIDAKGKYVCPGLIDGHVHIESSMVTPSEFARVVVPHGVTTVITDPHEIANVAGTKGIEFMLNDSDHIPLDVYVMLPSCVPATAFEHAGATLQAEHLAPFFSHPRVLGLAEVMDYPSLLQGKQQMLAKLSAAHAAGKLIDGHLAGLDETAVNVYRSANVHTDHECVTVHEALARVQRGMYVLIREGSVAKDLHKLLPAVNTYNARRFLFCTDDKHIDELVTEGSIDHHIRLAIQAGMNPLTAIQMATLNAAECYRLYTKGAIAPGYDADFLFVDDLHSFSITHVFKNGAIVAENGRATFSVAKTTSVDKTIIQSVHAKKLTKEDIQIPFTRGNCANVIRIIPNHLHTKRLITEVNLQNGVFQPSIERDLLKLVVVERHRGLGVGAGIVNGFQLKKGAIASSIAHDSHNIIAIGTNDDDIITAIEHIQHINGGLVVVENRRVLADLPLEIGGLMTTKSYEEVLERLQMTHDALTTIGASGEFNPFITLAFLALPVIPELKLTDQGLFDVSSFQFIDVEV